MVVIDDDDPELAAALRADYPTVKVLQQVNSGRSVAVNRGVALCHSDWICLVDDDDMWHRDKLAEVDLYLDRHPECQAVNHPVWFFRPTGGVVEEAYGFQIDFEADDLSQCHLAVSNGDPSTNDWTYLDIRGRSYELLLERNRGALSASVMRREIYQSAGGLTTGLTSADDWLLFLSVARLTEWHTLPRRLAFCRQHGTQSTNDLRNVRSILAAYNLVWGGGRPLPGVTNEAERRTRLSSYGPTYRLMAQDFIWHAVRQRAWDLLPTLAALSWPLLARRRDRLLILMPPRLNRSVRLE